MLTDRDIAAVFTAVFAADDEHQPTRLCGGFAEPSYVPRASDGVAEVRYTRDYPASALHEAAHWLLAGERRRQLPDYGYWYVGEPRPAAVQRAFLRVEARVQALESWLCEAAGLRFRASVDDFQMTEASIRDFERRVLLRARKITARAAWPARARRFHAALELARQSTTQENSGARHAASA